jgi:hypothetical protein
LNEHQRKGGCSVFNPIFTEQGFQPVAQKMKNKEQVERNKEAVDQQLY